MRFNFTINPFIWNGNLGVYTLYIGCILVFSGK